MSRGNPLVDQTKDSKQAGLCWALLSLFLLAGCRGATAPPVAEPPVFDLVAQRREWLGSGRCPGETMLLNMEPQPGLAREELEQLKTLVEQDGCTVLEKTEEVFESYVNPNEEEWRHDKLKGAFTAGVSVDRASATELTIIIGFWKGTLSAKSRVFTFRWDGEQWAEDTEKVVIRVS
jgi:hypothetical protein